VVTRTTEECDCGRECNADFKTGLLRLVPFLRSFAHSLCGDRDKAEDLLQETLCRAWQFQESFLPGSTLKAWVFTILRHQFYSGHRRAKWQGPWDQDEAECIPDSQTDQMGSVELSDTLRALQLLPARMRESLLLVGVGGYTCAEAAEICAVATGTVKSRVGRARRALTAILDGSEALPPASPRLNRVNAADQIVAELSRLNAGVRARMQ
jgi:RNA polymerase sigma factor (sigma-70 family)